MMHNTEKRKKHSTGTPVMDIKQLIENMSAKSQKMNDSTSNFLKNSISVNKINIGSRANSAANLNDASSNNSTKSNIKRSKSTHLYKNPLLKNNVLCHNCLKLHLDRCEICLNMKKMDNYIAPKSSESSKKPNLKPLVYISPDAQPKLKTKRRVFITEVCSSNNYDGSYSGASNYFSHNLLSSHSPFDRSATPGSSRASADHNLKQPVENFNKSLLAMVYKEKSGIDLNEQQIESLIDNDVIEVNNRSTPDNDSTFNKNSIADLNYNNTKTISLLKNEEDFLLKRKKSVSLNELPTKVAPSEYFFKNLNDLHKKIPTKNEKIKLICSPAPRTSNPLYNQIYKFDISEKYKTGYKLSPDIDVLIKKSSSALKDILFSKNENDIKAFISMNELDLESYEPENKTFFDPPQAAISQKRIIDLYRRRFELSIKA